MKILMNLLMVGTSLFFSGMEKPTLYIMGDSTVKNGDGTGKNNQVGWGTVIDSYFDTGKISIRNHAIGGRSSRTFLTEGRWDAILAVLKKGDYVMMQFGHNDASPLDDTARARGTLKGTGMDSVQVYNPIRKMQEVVHSYGWYLRKYVNEAKAKGAIPMICSPVPRNNFKNGRIDRTEYAVWAKQVADETGTYFIPLNDLVATEYEKMDTAKVRSFFPADHTHTNKEGAVLNAQMVVKGVESLDKCDLKNYLQKWEGLPAVKESLHAARLANQYFMNKWPDPSKPIYVPSRNKTWPGNIWTRAVYYEGLMALYSVDKQQAYYDYAVDWGTRHKWNVRGGTETRNADNQACGQTYIDLYLVDKKVERIDSIKASIDQMMRTDKIDDWHWIDAIQMAMPVFTRLGIIYNDTNYFHRMYEMYAYTKYRHGDKGLFNAAEGLWWRDKDFDPPYKEPNGANCYWSRGNGWVVAALVRVLDILPKTETHYAEYLADFKSMMKALAPLQRADGYWNVSLHDPSNFGGKELTGTSLFVYGMAWGMNKGILDKKKYLPIVAKAWNALIKESVHPNGFLGYVQGTGKEPKESQPVAYDREPDFEDFGLGCFLLAASEVCKMKQ